MLPIGMRDALAGVRVLALEQAVALPFATRHLAQLGADVIRVQSYERARATDQSSIELVRSKRQVGLNLAAEGGPEAFLRLASACDVVAHNFTPRVVRKFGIDYEGVRNVNPSVIYVSLTGFGTTGPWGERPLFGPGAEAVGGHNLLIGDPDGWPGRPGTGVYADDTCGMYTLFAILAALDERERTGEGQHIDISLYETMVAQLGPVLAEQAAGAMPRRSGNVDARYAVHDVFDATGHDRHVAIAATEEQREALANALGIPTSEHEAIVAAVASASAEDVVERLQARGIAASVVADARDLTTDEQLWARDFFEVREPSPGDVHPHQSGAWGGFPGTRVEDPHAVGADNDDVLVSVAGFTTDEIAALEASGAIGRAPGGLGSRGVGDAATRIHRGELSRVDDELPRWGERTRTTGARS
ncbi:MAG: CoA transferase [Dehalococcoidia bacterium]|nr:CoA transferase [Dehalococcoidia bacterium]